MRQMYSCPNCRAPVAYGDRFCGNCGINLNWAAQQMPPQSSPLSYGYQYPNQQQPWGQQPEWHQQSGWNQPPPYSQPPVWINPNQCQQRYMYDNSGSVPQKDNSSAGSTITPMRTEISKLLADLFDKHIKYKKV